MHARAPLAARLLGMTVLALLLAAASEAGAARLGTRLVGHYPAGRQPTGLALADEGRSLVVTNRGSSTVDVFDAESMEKVRDYPVTSVGHGAWGVAALGASEMLVANWVGESLRTFDRTTGAVTGTIRTGIKPSYLSLTPDGSRAFAAGLLSGTVTLIDMTARQPLRSLEVGQKPMGVVTSPDGRWLYVASCGSNKISKVDLRHEVVLTTFGAPLAETTNLAITPDGQHLLACGDDGRLLVVDTGDGSRHAIRVGSTPAYVALLPDATTALVTLYDQNEVAMVDLTESETYDRLPVGPGPIEVISDGRRLWTANDQADSITVYDLSPIRAIELPSAARAGQ